MTVSMGSNKKRNRGSVILWCLVLGLALLVDAASAQPNPLPPLTDCATFCHDYPTYYHTCLYICRYGLRVGAGHEEVKGGGGGGGGEVGLLAEGAGREEEGKRKQGGTAVHLPGWYCRERCQGQKDYLYCLRRCMASPSSGATLRLASHRGTGEEETRGGSGVGLQADGAGRDKEGKKNQEEHFCSFMCRYVHDKEDCLRQFERGPQGEEARWGGGGDGLLAMPAERAGREEEEEKGKRKQEDTAVHLSYNRQDYCYDLCIRKKGPEFPKCMKSCIDKVN